MEISIGAAVGIFGILVTLAGVIYQAGRLAARVESLEAWRVLMNTELGAIHSAIRDVEKIIRGEET
jgi:uncharacterized membrane protein HdeD (DUF308 family)